MAFQSSFTGNQIETCVGTYQNATQVQTAIASAKLAMYPIGSVYISTTNTDPSIFIGGTWTQIEDTFLLACGSTYTAGDIGGEATHTLTVAEMPSHSHSYYFDRNSSINWGIGLSGGSAETDRSAVASGPQGRAYTLNIRSNGGGGSHNNMPPYLAVYVWKRTA